MFDSLLHHKLTKIIQYDKIKHILVLKMFIMKIIYLYRSPSDYMSS